jgi:hypothetical protein
MWEFLLHLLRDQHAQEEFRHNPERVLHEHGLQHITASDVHDLVPLVTDHPGVEFGGDHGFSSPPPIFPAPGESETHCAIRHIEHFTRCYTYNIDNHNIDDSVHENIWAEGDVNQTFDDTNVLASGHAVAAGGGIWGSNVTTGNDNAVGTGNAVGFGNVTGSGNNVANGAGSAAGYGNSVINGSHDVQGDGNVTGHVVGSEVATTGGTNDNHLVSDSGNHLVSDSGNTDLHSFGAGATNTIGTDNVSATAFNSGNSSESHNFSDFGNSSDTTLSSGPSDENGTHFDHGGVGDSYGAYGLQGNCDPHDSAMELHIH